jgi:hypothetical protein
MKKFLSLILMFLTVGTLAALQDTTKTGKEAPEKDIAPKIAATPAYKLAFSIFELQDGKKINQREYSMVTQADNHGGNKLKIGSKVPIETGSDAYTYTDVGFELDCSAAETVNNKLAVSVEINISNFAIPEQNANPRTAGGRPVLRFVTQRVRALLTPGKPQVITSMDDVNSTKRMQVEVTATKVD